jgi:hypothetical protein
MASWSSSDSSRQGPAAGAAVAKPPAAAVAAPWTYAITELHATDGKIRVADEAVSPAFRVALSKVGVEGRKIGSSGDAGSLELAFDSEAGAHFGATANLDIAKSGAAATSR